VTGTAQPGFCRAAPLVIGGLVWIVTGQTVGVDHLRTVGFMAFKAIHKLPIIQAMSLVALAAILLGVHAGL